ncbi:hypothetical protein A2U01_0024300, partial [Trifolium medium]|nr:hypothetical protein [Trifolium medium]
MMRRGSLVQIRFHAVSLPSNSTAEK